jgi:hypothetical protein
MDIDNNDIEKKAMKCFNEKRNVEGEKLQAEFLKKVKDSGQDYCSCTAKCRYHGKCIDCVIIHRGHAEHLPECFHSMVNDKIKEVSCLTEHSFNINTNKKL